MKRCCICHQSLPVGEFYNDRSSKDGLQSSCKPCGYQANKRWREANPEKTSALQKRWRDGHRGARREALKEWKQANPERAREIHKRAYRKYRYGVTDEWYADAQAHDGCAICGDTERLCIDHDHTSGVARMLLCTRCNTGLGMFLESPARLRRAALYLEAFGA